MSIGGDIGGWRDARTDDKFMNWNDGSEDTNKMHRAATFLDALATRMDRWAEQSKTGGWSTHQVDENVRAAHECRVEASRLRK